MNLHGHSEPPREESQMKVDNSSFQQFFLTTTTAAATATATATLDISAMNNSTRPAPEKDLKYFWFSSTQWKYQS